MKNPGLEKLKEQYDRQWGEGPNWLLTLMLRVREMNYTDPAYWKAKEAAEKSLKDWDGVGSALEYVRRGSSNLIL